MEFGLGLSLAIFVGSNLLNTKLSYTIVDPKYLGQGLVKANFSLPPNMEFGNTEIFSILAYSIMLVIGLTTNTNFLWKSLKDRLVKKIRTRMSLLLIHLAIADLLVSMNTSLVIVQNWFNPQGTRSILLFNGNVHSTRCNNMIPLRIFCCVCVCVCEKSSSPL